MTLRTSMCVGMVSALVCTCSAAAQGPPPARVTVADGIDLELSMTGVKADAHLLESAARVRDGEVYRLILDGQGYARFAYALRVEPRTTGIEVVFRPVRLHEALRAFAPQERTYTSPFKLDSSLATLSDLQWSGVVKAGDAITLDLFHQPGTGQRIGDSVRVVSVTQAALAQLTASRAQRQERRPVLTLAGLKIRRAGRVLNEDHPSTFATGHAVAIGLGDGLGTVIFSAEEPSTHAPNGVARVQGRGFRFTLDGAEYECTTTEPIGPAGLAFVWMYVRREPLPHVKGFFLAGGDTVDSMLSPGAPRPGEKAAR